MSGQARAQIGELVVTDHAESRLVVERDAAQPGEIITVALMQTLQEGWHVYWRNPGDSGLPLSLDWDLAEGFDVGEVQYPLPHLLSLGPLVNYGHEGEPVFLIDMTVPENAAVGTIAEIAVDATWLICADICVPEDARLTVSLPISEAGGKPTGRYAVDIDQARREQPASAEFDAVYYDAERGPVLKLTVAPKGKLEFYPYAPSVTEPSAEVYHLAHQDSYYLGFQSGFAYRTQKPEVLAGVLTVEHKGQRRGFEIFANRIDPLADAPELKSAEVYKGEPAGQENTSADPARARYDGGASQFLLPTLLLAFLGGILLNVMPCVFPIVFLKAAGFASLAREDRGTVRLHGLLYTAGVLSAFAGLAIVLMVLRAGGEQLGWGFHLQSPITVAIFATILFLVGLNLFGLFEVGSSVQGVGNNLASSGGAAGAFFTGLLAVAVAAPCIGPLLGGAVGLALGQSAALGVLIFLLIGLGLAVPYLLLSLIPAAAKILPRPGPWMVTLRQLFAFAMFATVLWLVWVLTLQAGAQGVLNLGLAFLAISFGAWIFGRVQRGQSGILGRVAAFAMLVLAAIPISRITTAGGNGAELTRLGDVETMAWSAQAVSELRASNTPIFVDFTAAWCITCQVNKRTVLDTARVRQAFMERGVVYMVADWTNRDDRITAALEEFGRAGVPLYLYYGKDEADPVVLPQLLTSSGVLERISE